jgi:hypothetical protein
MNPPSHRSSLRPVMLALFAAALLAACGGGSGEPPIAGEVGRETPQAQANVVLRVDDAGVQRSGRFEPLSGSQSQGRQAWRSEQPGASVTFPVRVPRAGYYELFARWPQALSDAGSVQVEIDHASGQVRRLVDQRGAGGEWVSLGFHPFDPARPGQVALRAAGAVLYADALRWQYAGAERPALQWRTERLPVGLKDHDYDAQMVAAGGIEPYRYTLTEGALPPGLRLDETSGRVSGRAAIAGRYSAVITLRDAGGAVLATPIELVIDDTAASETSPPGLAPGAARREQRADAGGPNLGNLLNTIAALPEGGWQKVNLNSFSAVWTPADLRQLYGNSNPTPSKIILAWSSFAWDSNRARLVLYGGGHANYRGNDVYLWDATTQLWQRGSLPSAMLQDALGNWNAIDGAARAPASAHTYDNTMYFPLLDRVVVLGGAADANGGHYLTQATATTSRKTGPYLFDPARADGDKVGGSTGSHVQRVAPYPNIVGGDMWSNRESWLNAGPGSAPPSESFVNGCSGVAVENGKDVAYVRTAHRLYRYTIHDLNNPGADTWQLVGRYYSTGSGSQATCAYDTSRKLFVVAGRTSVPFVYWNLNTPASNNNEVPFTPVDPTGEFAQLLSSNAIDLRYCAMEFDPRRTNHKLWCGDGRVWTLTPPATLGASGWTIAKAASPTTAVPAGTNGTGILGKWKYIPNLDVFMGLADPVLGNVWVYKPAGWVNPAGGNLPPQVSLSQPSSGSAYTQGSPINLSAAPSDGDGSVVKVEYYANGGKIGESVAAPHGMVWTSAGVGGWTLTAVATDDDGAQGSSVGVLITVNPNTPSNQPPTVALDQPAAGTSFTFGTPIAITATAGDTDGTVARVEFYAGASKIGEDMQAPYEISWSSAPVGTHSLTAVAIDDDGAGTTSLARSVTVTGSGQGGTVTLQRGTNPAAVVADTYLSSYHKTLNLGTLSNVQDQREYYSSLLRFAIFQSEGGPVPNGAPITSAVLSIYKYSSYDMTYGVHRVLQAWQEGSATWNQRAPGLAWAMPGGNGADSDYASSPDATAASTFDPGWIHFDVTAAVGTMSSASPTGNHGWRLRAVSGYTTALKKMYASEFSADASLRPRLVISYQ